jgi:hypothetical protein
VREDLAMTLRVYLELGAKRVFACAADFPGWCRSGRTEEAALEALAEYRQRYRPVVAAAGLDLPPADDVHDFDIVERVPGTSTTDFGAPDAIPDLDRAPMDAAEARRHRDLVRAAWAAFDRAAEAAPAELRKGPRGGGRNRDKMIAHVVEAERAYARKIGVRHPPLRPADLTSVAALRADILAVLGAPSSGEPSEPKGWPNRYAARRIAWHALDHAWEMADRATP